jgi:enoyl-CoA hydratase/carnithine racemase
VLHVVCDLTIAADNAVFQVPELEHNIAPTLVMWAFLNRVPYKTAAHLVYTRERISAQRAEALGLVTKVVPAASLAAEADALSQSLLSRRVMALRGIKEFLTNASRMDPASATAYSSALNATLMTSAPPPPSEPRR